MDPGQTLPLRVDCRLTNSQTDYFCHSRPDVSNNKQRKSDTYCGKSQTRRVWRVSHPGRLRRNDVRSTIGPPGRGCIKKEGRQQGFPCSPPTVVLASDAALSYTANDMGCCRRGVIVSIDICSPCSVSCPRHRVDCRRSCDLQIASGNLFFKSCTLWCKIQARQLRLTCKMIH